QLVDAARAGCAGAGPDAQRDDLAGDAGVGVGPVSRHFPTKGALLEELAADKINRLTAWAHEALTAGDPGEAFFAYLRRVGELHAGDRTLSEMVASGSGAFPRLGSSLEALNAATDELLRRAHAAGGGRARA